MGAKLFAWLGGLALFLGIAFFVKYSFEHNLVSPELRVAMGFMVGLGLVAGGLWLPRSRQVVTAQTLCATGVLVLYADSLVSHTYYHFLGAGATFGLMALVTVAALGLAIRLEAQVIAVLGLLGGFLTPPLLSTGVDHSGVLFAYLGLLDAGLVALALRLRWNYLVPLGAGATALMEFGWVLRFFREEKILFGMGMFVGFVVLFVGALALAQRLRRGNVWMALASVLAPAAALLFCGYLLVGAPVTLAQRAWLWFGFVLLADLGLLGAAWIREELRPVMAGAGAAVFLLLALWTFHFLTAERLVSALACYLLFAVLHAICPVVLQRLRPSPMRLWWVHVYPSLALALILVPLVRLTDPPFWIWSVILLIDLLGIALAVITASLASILAVLLLTVV